MVESVNDRDFFSIWVQEEPIEFFCWGNIALNLINILSSKSRVQFKLNEVSHDFKHFPFPPRRVFSPELLLLKATKFFLSLPFGYVWWKFILTRKIFVYIYFVASRLIFLSIANPHERSLSWDVLSVCRFSGSFLCCYMLW